MTDSLGLKDGERYAGIILDNPSYHLILLQEQLVEVDWKTATAWAEDIGGMLPCIRELSLLSANLRDAFRTRQYWSRNVENDDDAYVWCHYFYDGAQNLEHKTYAYYACAVRRVEIK